MTIGSSCFLKKEDNTTFQLAKRLCSMLCTHVLCNMLYLYIHIFMLNNSFSWLKGTKINFTLQDKIKAR